MKRLGLGRNQGAANDDPSGIAAYSQARAQFGFGLAWTLVLIFPVTAIVPRAAVISPTGLLFVVDPVNVGADVSALGAATGMMIYLAIA